MVIDGHSWLGIDLYNYIIPYNSFFMPMFVFISGYFLEEKWDDYSSFILKKIKRLLLPYYLWNVLYGMLIFFLTFFGVHYGTFSLKNLIVGQLFSGECFDINSPAWFVPTLFLVEIIYASFRKLFANMWREYIAFALLLISSIFSIKLSVCGWLMNDYDKRVQLLRVIFLLVFFEMGVLYKKHFEEYLKKASKILVLICAIVIDNIAIIVCGDINFSVNRMGFNQIISYNNYMLIIPFITSIAGIAFWLTICDIVEPILGDNKWLNYVSSHTFIIMMNHVLFMVIFNWILVGINFFYEIPNLDVDSVFNSSWYRYEGFHNRLYLYYFGFGLFGSLIICRIIDGIKKALNNRKKLVKKQIEASD